MTQVLTVSATTAGYVAQGHGATVRANGGTNFEKNIEVWSSDAKHGTDFQLRGFLTYVQPPALALAFLTAGRQPEVSATTAALAYAENGPADIAEVSAVKDEEGRNEGAA
ncbi:hypothetical protein [Sinorhizobium sp. BG8]|uniref:hypothetical protein n=1 Tax=Sinorhizobium sp. BG8 TaxID=2613773 RepID=UPI00193D3172|nr:hypothetical protein [Sinorhizobium sp. BG8]QRM55595.1 hypothetical protein F3Y30_14490 [Sinorhizobium sp. BG8]